MSPNSSPLPFAASSLAAAQNITGTVTNGTTGKPAAGDEVTLLSLSQGMQEIGNSKTDAQGRFSFPRPTDATGAAHGARHAPGRQLLPAGRTADARQHHCRSDGVRLGKKIDGVSQTVEVDRLQSDGKQLEGITLYAITNKSQPPRTLANDKGTFEIGLAGGRRDRVSAEAKRTGRTADRDRDLCPARRRTITC